MIIKSYASNLHYLSKYERYVFNNLLIIIYNDVNWSD